MKKKSIFFITVPILVVAFGLIGYCGYLQYSFYEGLMSSLKLLKVEFGDLTNNIFVETARCLGILFYFSLLYAIAYALFDSIKLFWSVRHEDSVAVHGDSSMANYCASNIYNGKHCVLSDDKNSFKAKKQIIWFDDDTRSMSFYENNKKQLKNDDVYIALNDIPMDGKTESNIHFFNINERIASKYWGEHFITDPMKVTIIGSGALAEQILELALLTNVFSKSEGINYLVIGNFDRYNVLHPSLQEAVGLTGDNLNFSNSEWYSQIDEICDSDRVILVGGVSENTDIAMMLLNYGYKGEIHLRSESDDTGLLFNNEQVVLFGTLKEIVGEDGQNIFQDRIQEEGKLFDKTYRILSETLDSIPLDEAVSTLNSKSRKELIEENSENWNEMSSFLKRSNYLAAKHGVVKKTIIKKALDDSTSGIEADGFLNNGITQAHNFWRNPDNRAIVEKLEEVEHLRWWRLYLLNNFTYNENVGGDDKWILRQNANMKEYALLDEKTKSYDGIHYWLLPFNERV